MRQYNYDKLAKYYDVTELKAGKSYEKINEFLDKIFKKNKVKTVLDMTCGTGAQIIGLARRGYKITASDLSGGMLKIAKKKAKGLKIKFHRGDIRNVRYGKFDSVIAIFNAIGHLSKKDFEKSIRNVAKNLNKNGLFVFDIFNFDFMKAGGFISHPFIDVAMEHEGCRYVRFNDNKLNLKKRMMIIKSKTYVQDPSNKMEVYDEKWDMKIYSPGELKNLLEKNGFELVGFYDIKKRKFNAKKSLSIFVVARKK